MADNTTLSTVYSTSPHQVDVRIVPFWFPAGVIQPLGVGTRCFVGLLDDGTVLKYPKTQFASCPELEAERKIYEALGQHPFILTCLGWTGCGLRFPLRRSILEYRHKACQGQRRLWVSQCAVAVAYIHERGILHCDIHPNNVLLDDGHKIQLSDFQGVFEETDGGAMEATRYSMPQDWEQDSQPSAKRDIFALGCLIFWIMTGLHPHQDVADEDVEGLFKRFQMPATDFEFGDQVSRCWHQEYDHAGQLVSDLAARPSFGLSSAQK